MFPFFCHAWQGETCLNRRGGSETRPNFEEGWYSFSLAPTCFYSPFVKGVGGISQPAENLKVCRFFTPFSLD